MWRIRECSLNDEQLGAAVGVSGNAIRNRRNKPGLWKIADVERLATHFALSVTACIQLNQALHELPRQLKSLPGDERRKVERLLLVKAGQIDAFNQSGWPVRQLQRMHQSLVNAKL